MTITQLQYVLAVAEHQNFTHAAEKSFVTQPTLSMQIQKLEDELDILIFDRSKKPIQLTAVGEKIVEQARNIVNESHRIQDIVDQEKGFIGGEYRIGIIPTVMPTLLPLFLKNFVKKYPKVNLKIEEQNTDVLIEKLEEGYLDAAIAATPLGNPNIKESVLYYEPFVAYIPQNHKLYPLKKVRLEDLDLEDILLLEDGHCFREGVINLCKNKNFKDDQFHLESGSFETMMKLADEGLGMTLLPFLHTMDLSESQKMNLRFFHDPNPAREVSLIYHKSELKTHITNALKDIITGVIRGAIAFQDVKIVSPIPGKNISV